MNILEVGCKRTKIAVVHWPSQGEIQGHMTHWCCLLTMYSIVDAAIILGLSSLYKDPAPWDILQMFLFGELSSSNTFSAARICFLRRWSSWINWLQWHKMNHFQIDPKIIRENGNQYYKTWKIVLRNGSKLLFKRLFGFC